MFAHAGKTRLLNSSYDFFQSPSPSATLTARTPAERKPGSVSRVKAKLRTSMVAASRTASESGTSELIKIGPRREPSAEEARDSPQLMAAFKSARTTCQQA